jgi:hypothetical protein
MAQRILAPGLDFVSIVADRSSTDVLRADIVGFGGVFERGPVFVARRIEDWGGQRAVFGGFFRLRGRGHRQALGPLALYGFQQNGGGTAIVVRVGARDMRPAFATVPDPATGGLFGLMASSPGAWANGVRMSVPLRVGVRVGAAAFPLTGSSLTEKSIVRVRSAGGIAFGRLISGTGGLTLSPPTVLPGPYVIEVLDPMVDVTIDGAGRHERYRALSLDPGSDRYLWKQFAAAEHPGPEWTPRVPPPWLPLDERLALALAQQGPGASALVRAVDLKTPYASPGALPVPWPAPTAATKASAGEGAIEVLITGGVDAVKSTDIAAFRSAIELLAEHPLPSVVAIPDFMLAVLPAEDPCARKADTTRLPPLVPPLTGCADPSSGPDTATTARGGPAWPPAEADEDDDIPTLGPPSLVEEAIATLQLDLLTAIATAERMASSGPDGPAERIALLDPRPSLAPAEVMKDALALSQGAPRPELGVLFYPWVRVLDPSRGGATTALVPPSGHIAGLMARTTRIGGGPSARFANEFLAGAVQAERALDYEERGRINIGQVCARARPCPDVASSRSVRAPCPLRTIRCDSFPDRESLRSSADAPCRRGDACLRAERPVPVAAHHGHDRAALRELFEAGAFAGRTPAESYRVRCDEVTNPDDERTLGRLVALVDIALAVPLEFITLRIAFTRDGARVTDDITAGAEA